MAGSSLFAHRYASAFANVAASAGLDIAAAQHGMKDFADTLNGSHELREILTDPSVPADQKLNVIDALAERFGVIREVRNFIAVIMDHGRLGELNEIIAEYDRVADAKGGLCEAEVTSAHDLNPQDRQALEARVAELAGSRVRVAYKLDPSLLGGAIVRIGSTVYDGSVRSQLEQLKHTLVTA